MKLNERDMNILKSIREQLIFAQTSHIAKLFFPNSKVASRRLHLFVKAGYLEFLERPTTCRGRGEYVYFLSSKAHKDLFKNTVKRSKIPAIKELAHTLMINDVIVNMIISAKSTGYKIQYFTDRFLRDNNRFENYIRENGSFEKAMYPDITFVLTKRDKKALLLVEIDRATMAIQSNRSTSIKEKIETMASYLDEQVYTYFNTLFNYGFKGFRYLIISSGARKRPEQIINSCKSADEDYSFVWLTHFDRIDENVLVQPIWSIMRNGSEQEFSLTCQDEQC